MAHSHAHTFEAPARPRLAKALAIVVGVIAVAAIAGMVALWPNSGDVPQGGGPFSDESVTLVDATVESVEPFDCGSTGIGPDNTPMVEGDCAQVTAATEDDESAEFTLDPTRYVGAGMEPGDEIVLIEIAPPGQQVSYEFHDYQRGSQLLVMAIVFGVLVALIGRWRGLFAILGIGVTLLALVRFVLPALLAGGPALAIAIVGSTAIMLVVLYLAHGISIRTTAALFGTLFGIAFTALAGAFATGWAHLTGVGSEDDHLLVASAPEMSLSGVVAATMVIAGLGVLNDVTVTQASAVWEMRGLQPTAGPGQLFRSAMRIGRDHIASSVYTLVFAYAGSAMTVLLLITTYQQELLQVATTEQIGQEIVRTLVGAVGLVLAVPVTTAIAVALAPPAAGEHANEGDLALPTPGGEHAESGAHTAPGDVRG
ncbi:YibE/F family protein [Aeromicrobium phragmitis]|uniref:YibE/F family protein n=1 Tax=Aeromicrobium phragmitis TaxID=2478914 RepID=A0A3L8PMR4_9ACTN|nr:YibE/F family protein [Aeromicrobium phragmitis]RLV55788.1 YibE/F family protein [Aeromicrobium phragmitis]